MKLSKVVYLNLSIHIERDATMRQWLASIGVPSESILRIEGKDAATYEDREAIIDAGVADGFTELRELSNMPEWYGKGDAAYAWAIRCVLREVRDAEGACIVLLDDAELLKQFYEYETLVAETCDFDIIQLAPWLPPETSTRFYNLLAKMPEPSVCDFDIRFQHGCPYPGEHANIYSPDGARKMLDALSRPGNIHIFPEGINEHFGHGSVWRLISVKDFINQPWAISHNDFSYRVEQNKMETLNGK